MEEYNLIKICMTAFIAVFSLLTLLAVVMKFMTKIFPKIEDSISAAHVAAINVVYSKLFPNSTVIRIEEKNDTHR